MIVCPAAGGRAAGGRVRLLLFCAPTTHLLFDIVLVCAVVPAHTEMKHQKKAQRKKSNRNQKKSNRFRKKNRTFSLLWRSHVAVGAFNWPDFCRSNHMCRGGRRSQAVCSQLNRIEAEVADSLYTFLV
jgi:hypothetical protein